MITLCGLSAFGRTGATRNNAGAGDSTTNVGVVATVDPVFIALGAGNDTLNIGACAASPAFGSASRFQFDGGQGVNTINASPLSIGKYTVGSVPAKPPSKITGFRNINGALP